MFRARVVRKVNNRREFESAAQEKYMGNVAIRWKFLAKLIDYPETYQPTEWGDCQEQK